MIFNSQPEDKLVLVSVHTLGDGILVEHEHGQERRLTMGEVDMMDPQGNLVAVPLQCGFRYNATGAAQVYEMQTKMVNLGNGFVPVSDCPHTFAYSDRLWPNATKKPLQPIPVDATPEQHNEIMRCSGGNCSHFQALRTARLATARETYEKANREDTKIDIKNLEQFMRAANLAALAPLPKEGRKV